jgi:hypothetical protein
MDRAIAKYFLVPLHLLTIEAADPWKQRLIRCNDNYLKANLFDFFPATTLCLFSMEVNQEWCNGAISDGGGEHRSIFPVMRHASLLSGWLARGYQFTTSCFINTSLHLGD